MPKQKLTRENLRKIIAEEKQKLEEATEVGTMDGSVEVMARAKGDYVLTMKNASGNKSMRLSKRQMQDLLDAITFTI